MEEEGDEIFYFGDHVLPLFETGMPLLKQCLHQLPDADNVLIAFPNDGALKRFHKQLDHFPTVNLSQVLKFHFAIDTFQTANFLVRVMFGSEFLMMLLLVKVDAPGVGHGRGRGRRDGIGGGGKLNGMKGCGSKDEGGRGRS
ncbi:hypothetical protein CTI12_AA495370 [Artemisia annua]|uniref:Uncharacterized protein n=1 Tax=Artemisia annua TaxID=35608 RepID=A0A2U1LFS7_ARTAN|nr:hypothetical protein CTI12_AA495370 [Artemisia annua]